MIELIPCPEPECDQSAEVLEMYWQESTSGPTRMIKTMCVKKHYFHLPERR